MRRIFLRDYRDTRGHVSKVSVNCEVTLPLFNFTTITETVDIKTNCRVNLIYNQ